MKRNRLNITQRAIHWYTKRYTLSFCWRCRWHWWPEITGDSIGGWCIIWGCCFVEKLVFDLDDDWGDEMAEYREMILHWLEDDDFLEEG